MSLLHGNHALWGCVSCVMTILFVSYWLNVDLDKRFKIVCSRWSCKCLCNVICVCMCVQEYTCVHVLVCLYVCVHMYVYIEKLDGYYGTWPCNAIWQNNLRFLTSSSLLFALFQLKCTEWNDYSQFYEINRITLVIDQLGDYFISWFVVFLVTSPTLLCTCLKESCVFVLF